MQAAKRSRPVVSTLLFLAAALGQVFLWKGPLSGMPLSEQPPAVLAELCCCAVICLLALLTATPKGLRGPKRCWAALAGVVVYAAFNLLNLSAFAAYNLSGIESGYQSYGTALVALKLFFVLAAAIAAIPVASGPSGREYANRLMTAAQRQSAQWASEGAKGAQKDLQRTIDKLREQLPPEELEKLLQDLKKESAATAAPQPAADAPQGAPAGDAPAEKP